MKLKKIVSLALAGILAVSMLAGCGDNGDSNSNTNPPADNTPVGYTATIYNLANGSSKAVLTAGSGNVLKAAVESVADAVNTTEFVTDNGVTALTAVRMVTRNDNGNKTYDVITNMDRYVAGNGDWNVYGDVNGEGANHGLAFTDNEADGTKVYVLLAPSSLSETKINADVASEVNELAAGLAKDTATQTFSYTLGVERALVGSENEGVYVIAIQITKSSTDKA